MFELAQILQIHQVFFELLRESCSRMAFSTKNPYFNPLSRQKRLTLSATS